MSVTQDFAVHEQPVWRERSNFIINAQLSEDLGPQKFEQLFAKRLDDDRFQICCIPFFVYDLALGDVVRTSALGELKYVFAGVVERSGRYVFRVWFGDSFQPRDEVDTALKSLGSLTEWSSRNLLAVDVVDAEHAQLVADFLAEREKAGHLIYETGRS